MLSTFPRSCSQAALRTRTAKAPPKSSVQPYLSGEARPEDVLVRLEDRCDLTNCQQLGSGSFGDVLLVVDRFTGKRLALKVVSLERLRQVGAEATSLRREIEALLVVSHSNIVRLQDVYFTQLPMPLVQHRSPFVCIAMDLIDNSQSLSKLITAAGPQPRLAVKILAQLSAALQEIHAKGYVHRDVWSENVLVDAEGRAVLVDFGCAARYDVGPDVENRLNVPYMSPQASSGERQQPGDDCWALGCLLTEIVSGRFIREELGCTNVPLHARPVALERCIQCTYQLGGRGLGDLATKLLELRAEARLSMRDLRPLVLAMVASEASKADHKDPLLLGACPSMEEAPVLSFGCSLTVSAGAGLAVEAKPSCVRGDSGGSGSSVSTVATSRDMPLGTCSWNSSALPASSPACGLHQRSPCMPAARSGYPPSAGCPPGGLASPCGAALGSPCVSASSPCSASSPSHARAATPAQVTARARSVHGSPLARVPMAPNSSSPTGASLVLHAAGSMEAASPLPSVGLSLNLQAAPDTDRYRAPPGSPCPRGLALERRKQCLACHAETKKPSGASCVIGAFEVGFSGSSVSVPLHATQGKADLPIWERGRPMAEDAAHSCGKPWQSALSLSSGHRPVTNSAQTAPRQHPILRPTPHGPATLTCPQSLCRAVAGVAVSAAATPAIAVSTAPNPQEPPPQRLPRRQRRPRRHSAEPPGLLLDPHGLAVLSQASPPPDAAVAAGNAVEQLNVWDKHVLAARERLVPGAVVGYKARTHDGEYRALVVGRIPGTTSWLLRVADGVEKIIHESEIHLRVTR
eukprot:TRINITY_DN72763_c0_g1_i1.p1 TRINITY_DN72763_c0_g1~~TRINITY_DN72763_c0_g1_i1.p1  ORF type:complete len:805 (+),score=86.66 TRINITY_DN72763_c0_g1_i1:65-2479(+)